MFFSVFEWRKAKRSSKRQGKFTKMRKLELSRSTLKKMLTKNPRKRTRRVNWQERLQWQRPRKWVTTVNVKNKIFCFLTGISISQRAYLTFIWFLGGSRLARWRRIRQNTSRNRKFEGKRRRNERSWTQWGRRDSRRWKARFEERRHHASNSEGKDKIIKIITSWIVY